jgi:hypothetical protein
MLALYCSCISACLACINCVACPHILHALSGALETCARALETCVSSCTGMTFSLFFMLERRAHREPRDTWQQRSPSQPGGEVQRHRTLDSVGAHICLEARSGTIGHVIAPEPISAGSTKSETIGHVAAPEPISVGRRDPKS